MITARVLAKSGSLVNELQSTPGDRIGPGRWPVGDPIGSQTRLATRQRAQVNKIGAEANGEEFVVEIGVDFAEEILWGRLGVTSEAEVEEEVVVQ